jgi:hypothetical protein
VYQEQEKLAKKPKEAVPWDRLLHQLLRVLQAAIVLLAVWKILEDPVSKSLAHPVTHKGSQKRRGETGGRSLWTLPDAALAV